MILEIERESMTQKTDLFIALLNEQISACGLPALSTRKTKTFVALNDGLLKLELNDIIKLVDDYGLLFPAFSLCDVNVDYAILLQNRSDLDISGFIRYMDIYIIRTTENNKTMLRHYTGISGEAPKETRRLYIKETLERMINTHQKSPSEIVQSIITHERDN